jgi:hypothetical protein
MSSGMRGRAGMILAFSLRRVARCRQRQVLKRCGAAGTGPPPAVCKYHDRPHFALTPDDSNKQITPAFSVGRGKPGGREVY